MDPVYHPFERAREYTRALNATKLERLLSQPFVAALSGHVDGVYTMARHPTNLDCVVSGSGDGELRMWSLFKRECEWKVNAHHGFVRGITVVPFSSVFISVGDDKMIKMWKKEQGEPIKTHLTKSLFTAVDHHRKDKVYATASSVIELWDHGRSTPVQTLSWGAETIVAMKMNQVETHLLASCGTDRTVCLYDLRTHTPIAKCLMDMRSNAIAWNPMEAFNFTVANEDHQCYTFDMRQLSSAINVLKDHVSAVMDVDYSPTGQEIVTASYDKTIRLFDARSGHSRDMYHTKRMQKVFTAKFTMDGKHILSGSDDGNLRLWKTKAYEKDGFQTQRERNALNYAKALKTRYKNMPEIKRIDKHRFVPKAIQSASRIKRIQLDSERRKKENIRQHSAPGTVRHQKERQKHILSVE